MADALQELSQLSKDLQFRAMTVVAVHRTVQRLIVVLEARKLRFGPYYDTAKEAIMTGVSWCAISEWMYASHI